MTPSPFSALKPDEAQQVDVARSMSDSSLRNALRNAGVNPADLDRDDLLHLAGVCVVTARRIADPRLSMSLTVDDGVEV